MFFRKKSPRSQQIIYQRRATRDPAAIYRFIHLLSALT